MKKKGEGKELKNKGIIPASKQRQVSQETEGRNERLLLREEGGHQQSQVSGLFNIFINTEKKGVYE